VCLRLACSENRESSGKEEAMMELFAVFMGCLAFGLASGTLPMVIKLRKDVSNLQDELNRTRGT
jgi:hypothetical protein